MINNVSVFEEPTQCSLRFQVGQPVGLLLLNHNHLCFCHCHIQHHRVLTPKIIKHPKTAAPELPLQPQGS